MSLKARPKHGVSGSWSYLGDASETGSAMFYALEGRYLQGDVDYDGGLWDGTPFKASDLRDYYFEVVMKAGKTYTLGQRLELTPYSGLAWRQLRNHLEESGEGGYLRQSTYIYLPFGAYLTYRAAGEWKVRLMAEGDILLLGSQNSYFEDWGKITNEQHNGYGLRASAKIEKDFGRVGVFVEPFWRYWEIDNSEVNQIYVIGEGWQGLLEPKNRTHEYGLKVGVSF